MDSEHRRLVPRHQSLFNLSFLSNASSPPSPSSFTLTYGHGPNSNWPHRHRIDTPTHAHHSVSKLLPFRCLPARGTSFSVCQVHFMFVYYFVIYFLHQPSTLHVLTLPSFVHNSYHSFGRPHNPEIKTKHRTPPIDLNSLWTLETPTSQRPWNSELTWKRRSKDTLSPRFKNFPSKQPATRTKIYTQLLFERNTMNFYPTKGNELSVPIERVMMMTTMWLPSSNVAINLWILLSPLKVNNNKGTSHLGQPVARSTGWLDEWRNRSIDPAHLTRSIPKGREKRPN